MIGHLGNRVSALLDGQLSARESEEAWSHVYLCHTCRDLVEREGWVKTRLAGLCAGEAPAPSALKGSLLSMPPEGLFLAGATAQESPRRGIGAVAIGGSAVGAAMLGVLAFGVLGGSTPVADRRPPATQITIPATPAAPSLSGTGPRSDLGGAGSGLQVPALRMLP